MIVIDTSARMAVLLDEPAATACIDRLSTTEPLTMSAGTMAEALIVADRRGCGREMRQIIDDLGIVISPVTPATARSAADAYGRWGKGIDPASINFGDCFAYVLANETASPLLYVGADFSGTDQTPAIQPTGQ